MIEVRGNLWTYPADIRVITTNGTVKKNGECVMGRGCAAQAKARWPFIAGTLGRLIKEHGNQVLDLGPFPQEWQLNDDGSKEVVKQCGIFSFPVKHEWHQKADLGLIAKSANELVEAFRDGDDLVIVLPRPGCGNGGLKWEEVKLILEPILDDRFHVITF